MKIEITPLSLQDFVEKNMPCTLTVHNKGVSFNRKSVGLLSLKVNVHFLLEFEDSKFYLKDSADKGFRISAEMKGSLLANIPGLSKFIGSFLKQDKTSYKFEIGEFKLGRRELMLID